jgi:hypothetical protein
MKLISLSCIANEEDIIETFVRVNATFIDTFFFVDDSTDGTGAILDALKNEGYDIHRLFRNRSEPYVQEYATYRAIQHVIKNKFEFDHLFILDSDEFPKFESRIHAINVMASVPDGCISIYQWETYVPVSLGFAEAEKNVLQDKFRRRSPEGTTFDKVVIPSSLIDRIYVSVGSHNAYGLIDDQLFPLPKSRLPIALGHFPVRSADQILRKNLNAVGWLLRKKDRGQGEGWHVYHVLRKLLGSNFNITKEMLTEIALLYANQSNSVYASQEPPMWLKPYELTYASLKTSSTTQQLSNMLINSWLDPLGTSDSKELKDQLSH